MFAFILGGIIGLVVGWNLSQPKWARDLQDKVTNKTRL